ncbi:protein kinase [Streptomyces kaempferi]|uniref:protein kinase n=1 Tax=Streptomyces kaempferi TaxID=333725 RepID=UPI003615DAF1
MDEYAGRVLADRYRLPLPPSDEYEFAESRAFDTYSGQEVLVRQVPLPEVVEAEVLDADGLPEGFVARDGGVRRASARTTRRPAEPAVRRAIEAAQAAAQIPDHPRLDQVFDVFAEGGSLWIVSELVPARPLAALLAEKPLSPYRAAEVAADVLTALRVLHAHGWVHRNITARTVLVCDDGRVMLTGLAAGAAEEALCGYDPVPVRDFEGPAGAEDAPAGPGVPGTPGARGPVGTRTSRVSQVSQVPPVPRGSRAPGGEGGATRTAWNTGSPGAHSGTGPSRGVSGVGAGAPGATSPGGTFGAVVAGAQGIDAEAARRAAIEARAENGTPVEEPPAAGSAALARRALDAGGDARAARAGAIAAYRAGARAAARVHEQQRGGPAALPAPRPAPPADSPAPPAQATGHIVEPRPETPPPGQIADPYGVAHTRAWHGAQPRPGTVGPGQGIAPGPGSGREADRTTGGRAGHDPAQAPGQSAGQGFDQGAGQGLGQSASREIEHNSGRGTDQGFGQGAGAGVGQGFSEGTGQGFGQGADHNTGQGFGQGVGHHTGQGFGQGTGQGFVQGVGQGSEYDAGRGIGERGPGQGVDPGATRGYGHDTGQTLANPAPQALGQGGGQSRTALPGGGAGHGLGAPELPGGGVPALVPGPGPQQSAVPVPPTGRWDELVAGTPPRRGPATALAAERARQARMAVVGPVTERWAPEQAGPVHENWQLAAPIGPATDLWALGALLFRAVQGHAPYPEENTAELVQLVCAEPPAYAEECGPLRPVVESLLRQDPTERLDFEELRGWLRSLVRSAPEPEAGAHVVAAPPVDPSRLPIVRRRGELVRRRRAGLPATSPHARHKRARSDRPVRPAGRAGQDRPRRLGRNLLLLVLLLLVAAVAYAMVFMPKNDRTNGADRPAGSGGQLSPAPDNSSGTGADGSASSEPRPDQTSPGGDKSPSGKASSSTSESNAPGAAEGFTLRKDSAGFQVAVANGWDRSPKNGRGQVVYSHGDFELIVVPGRDSTATYGSDPLTYQRERESELQPFRDSTWATSSGMRRIDVGGRTMAEGQFTWQNSAGQELYVRNLVIVTGGQYHIVQVRGPEAEMDEVTRLYEQASATYQVTG